MEKRLTLNDVVLGNLRRKGGQNAILALIVTFSIFFLSVSVFGFGCALTSADEYQKNRGGEANAVVYDIREADAQTLVSDGIFSRVAVEELLYASAGDPENKDDDFTIARYTPEVGAMMRVRAREGRLPEAPGEIAIEVSAMARLRSSAGIGDEITLSLLCGNGEEALPDLVDMRFTLVGILESTGFAINDFLGDTTPLFRDIAEAFVSPDEKSLPGTRAVRTALGVWKGGAEKLSELEEWWNRNQPGRESAGQYREIYSFLLRHTSGDSQQKESEILIYAVVVVFLALTIAALTGVASALNASVDGRKTQIGMLRAIGATGTQIKRLLYREAFAIAGITLPLGVGLAAGALFAASRIFPGYVVFSVPGWLIFLDAAVCCACVLVSSVAPVRRCARIMPMQAVRDVDLSRTFLWKGGKSRESFVPQRLLAKRNNSLRPGRTAALAVLAAVGATLFAAALWLCTELLANYRIYSFPTDYKIINYFSSYESGLLNEEFFSNRLTSADAAEIANLPYVERVDVRKTANIALLVDTASDYVTGGSVFTRYGYLSPEIANEEKRIIEAGRASPEAEENWRKDARMRNAEYLRDMEAFGWEGIALSGSIAAYDASELDALSQNVVDGRIDIDKLNSGEEVLIIAPSEYIVRYQTDPDSPPWPVFLYGGQTAIPGDAVFENDTFRAGDEIAFGFAWSREARRYTEAEGWTLPDEYETFTRKARIGAVISNSGLGFSLITSEAGLYALGIDANIYSIDVYVSDAADGETRAYLSERIANVAARTPESYFSDSAELARQDRRIALIITAASAAVLVLLFAFTWSLLSGSVAGRIRSDVRQIGTMRAVGASKRAIFGSYAGQLLRVFLIGGSAGVPLTAGVISVANWYRPTQFIAALIARYALFAVLYLAALFLMCLISVRGKLKPIFRASVVDNIRIL